MNKKGQGWTAIFKGGVPLVIVMFGIYLWIFGNTLMGLIFILFGAYLFVEVGKS